MSQEKRSPEYKAWYAMRHRCSNNANANYSLYGGRGIRVCSEWDAGFNAFIADMGPRPDGMTLERIDVNSGYFPENCIWADRKAQANNRTNNRVLSIRGRTKTVALWAMETRVAEAAIRTRLAKGWAAEAAVFTPSAPKSCTKNAGEDNANSKITRLVAGEIRRRWSAGESQKNIAKHYSIDPSQVSRIVRNKAWV
jgi:hypothetical protein